MSLKLFIKQVTFESNDCKRNKMPSVLVVSDQEWFSQLIRLHVTYFTFIRSLSVLITAKWISASFHEFSQVLYAQCFSQTFS